MSALKMRDCKTFQKLLVERRASSGSDFMDVVCDDKPNLSYEFVFCRTNELIRNNGISYDGWINFIQRVRSWISTRASVQYAAESKARDVALGKRLTEFRGPQPSVQELNKRWAVLKRESMPPPPPPPPSASKLADLERRFAMLKEDTTPPPTSASASASAAAAAAADPNADLIARLQKALDDDD
jgi:hypothetical protein